jgi:NADH:ubiquinone oxidoreductase subunit 3 (subunit A)
MSGVPHCHISIINTIEKLSAYECGLEPVGDARMKFEILYYVIGILYLIFDLEIIFLFPLAALLFTLNSLIAFWVVMLFVIILTIGFVYEWFHGALYLYLGFSARGTKSSRSMWIDYTSVNANL